MSGHPSKNRRLLLSIVLVAAAGGVNAASTFNGKDVSASRIGGALNLVDHHGKRRTWADFRGKAVLLFFGYTRCPDVCPTTLLKMAETLKVLGPDAAKVQVLWVTVDPERDTQVLLSNYVPAFNPEFLGLRGSLQETEAFTDAYKVGYQILYYKNEVLVDHSSFGYLVDKRGRTRIKISYDATPTQIAQDVRAILSDP
jgi:protein SCO1/2